MRLWLSLLCLAALACGETAASSGDGGTRSGDGGIRPPGSLNIPDGDGGGADGPGGGGGGVFADCDRTTIPNEFAGWPKGTPAPASVDDVEACDFALCNDSSADDTAYKMCLMTMCPKVAAALDCMELVIEACSSGKGGECRREFEDLTCCAQAHCATLSEGSSDAEIAACADACGTFFDDTFTCWDALWTPLFDESLPVPTCTAVGVQTCFSPGSGGALDLDGGTPPLTRPSLPALERATLRGLRPAALERALPALRAARGR